MGPRKNSKKWRTLFPTAGQIEKCMAKMSGELVLRRFEVIGTLSDLLSGLPFCHSHFPSDFVHRSRALGLMRLSQLFVMLSCLLFCGGCHGPWKTSRGPIGQPMFVACGSQDAVWERTVDVLHEYPFSIRREDRLDGVIETDYKTGSGILEPWHKDSVGHDQKMESTLQSIRRRVVVNVTPVEGGFFINVEAYKELEDLVGLAANSAGGATFQESTPLQRDLDLVVGQTSPSGWISQGRDFALEQDILERLSVAFGP
jgi:hypothetical protein